MKAKVYVIGIAGGSGSGKTTFVKKLEEFYTKDQICVFSMDNYYKNRDDQEIDENDEKNFDLPSSFRSEEFFLDVKKLMSGKDVTLKEYTFNNDLVEPKMLTFKSTPVIILEGIFLFHFKPIADLMDLKIFLDVDTHLKLIRRIARDNTERNYPLEDVLYKYEKHVYPSFQKYIMPHKKSCDLVINNNTKQNFNKGMEVMKTFIDSKLK